MFQKAGARRIVLVTGRTPAPPPAASARPSSACAASAALPSPSTTKPWMPWRSGPTPVAIVVHREGEADGSIERSVPVAPRSMMRLKAGILPRAASGSITCQSAPSIPKMTTRPGRSEASAGPASRRPQAAVATARKHARSASRRDREVTRRLYRHRSGGLELVLDLAEDLLDDVLHRQDADRLPLPIDHRR